MAMAGSRGRSEAGRHRLRVRSGGTATMRQPPRSTTHTRERLVIMAFQDIIAQLRQDITTAEDAGDEQAVARLRQELDKALQHGEETRER